MQHTPLPPAAPRPAASRLRAQGKPDTVRARARLRSANQDADLAAAINRAHDGRRDCWGDMSAKASAEHDNTKVQNQLASPTCVQDIDVQVGQPGGLALRDAQLPAIHQLLHQAAHLLREHLPAETRKVTFEQADLLGVR